MCIRICKYRFFRCDVSLRQSRSTEIIKDKTYTELLLPLLPLFLIVISIVLDGILNGVLIVVLYLGFVSPCFKISHVPSEILGPKWQAVNIWLPKYILQLHLELEIQLHHAKPTYRHFFSVSSHRLSITNSAISVTAGCEALKEFMSHPLRQGTFCRRTNPT